MTIALRIIAGAVGVLGLVLLGLYLRFVRTNRRALARVTRALEPILADLRCGKAPQPELIQEAASNPRLRNSLYLILMLNKRVSLFPKEYLTWEAIAESEMTDWLCHPSELGCPPDVMELMHTVPLRAPDGHGDVHYFLFRFRTCPPHRCAERGWLAGVTGPYDLSADPVPGGLHALSRFEPYDSRTPQEHVELLHRIVGRTWRRSVTPG